MPVSITGRVIDSRVHRGIPGLRVEACAIGIPVDQAIGRARTDEEGTFRYEREQGTNLTILVRIENPRRK